MKGIVLNRNLSDKISLEDVRLPDLAADEVRVKIKAAALNHRDEWCRQGLYPNLKDGVVLGSDGAGIVEEVGSADLEHWLGNEVIINPANNWGDQERVQAKDFFILGMPTNGTFAEKVQVKADRLHMKPSHLSWEEAAALPLAGLTAYRALMVQGGLITGEKVLVTGIGGGVAQFAFQFALAAGADVSVSSGDEPKLQSALNRGASHGFNYRDNLWAEKALSLTGGFDCIIDSAMGDTLGYLIKVCRPGARIVFYGATKGNPSGFDSRKVFWNQLKLIGSTMGSDADFIEMLNFVDHHKIKPVIDKVYSLDQAVEALDRMKNGLQSGKIVLSIS